MRGRGALLASEGSFLDEPAKRVHLDRIDRAVALER